MYTHSHTHARLQSNLVVHHQCVIITQLFLNSQLIFGIFFFLGKTFTYSSPIQWGRGDFVLKPSGTAARTG